MTNKRYEFFDDCWFNEGWGCDCCPSQWMEVWNCDKIEHSTHSVEDSYVAAISHATQMSYDAEDILLSLSLEELEELAKVLNIDVVFIS
jgi:hypothetical protein